MARRATTSFERWLAVILLAVSVFLVCWSVRDGAGAGGAVAGQAVLIVPGPSGHQDVALHLVFPQDQPVLAHYTEHLAWLPNIGKDSRPEDRDSNAWTSNYAIGYRLSGPEPDLPDLLRQLKVVFDPIDMPQDFADQERDIILREYDWRMANNIYAQAAVEMEAFLYAGNAIAASVIGTPAEISALAYDEARAFHAATHRPERARLLVVGNVSRRDLARAMAQAGFPDLDARREKIGPPPFHLGAPETRTFAYPDAAPRMTWRKVVALPEPVDLDLGRAQAALAADILDSTLPGGLAGPLRFDAFVTSSFRIAIAPIDERHVELSFTASPDKGISFAALQAAFEAALAVSAQGVPADTYERLRQRFDRFWPDWADADATARWMARYSLARVAALRDPKTAGQIRTLDGRIMSQDIDALLAALAGPGRTAITFFGTDQTQ